MERKIVLHLKPLEAIQVMNVLNFCLEEESFECDPYVNTLLQKIKSQVSEQIDETDLDDAERDYEIQVALGNINDE